MTERSVTWPKPVIENVRRLKFLSRSLQDLFTGRDPAIDLIALSAVCHEHMLLIGPPGTAKTEIITRFADLIDARAFHYLLTRYTEPTELFGPLDLQQFQKGTYHIRTTDMLPEAQIVFLDEVFQGSSPILNSLLTILNERTFHNGSVRQPVPLICMIGAANTVPDDPWLQAFADRFVLRLEISRRSAWTMPTWSASRVPKVSTCPTWCAVKNLKLIARRCVAPRSRLASHRSRTDTETAETAFISSDRTELDQVQDVPEETAARTAAKSMPGTGHSAWG